MSLYIGPDSSGTKILHNTDGVSLNVEDMKSGPTGDTLIHSEMPYIVVKERFKLDSELALTYLNNTPFNGGRGHRAWGNIGDVGVDFNPHAIDQGSLPQGAKDLLALGYFYTIAAIRTNLGTQFTIPAHINMCGTGNLSPIYGGWQSVKPAISIGGSVASFTGSTSAYPSGGSFFTPVQITTVGFTGSRAQASITPNRDLTLRYDEPYTNNDLYIPIHDHVLSPLCNYYQMFIAQSGFNYSGNIKYTVNGPAFPAFPANPTEDDPYIELTFFNIRLVNGNLVHEPIGVPSNNEVKISKDELTLKGINLLDYSYLQFNAPKTTKDITDINGQVTTVPDLYGNVQYFQTTANCDAPTPPVTTRDWWDLNDIAYAGLQEGSNLVCLQVEGSGHVLPNTINWGEGGLGGPNLPMGTLGGIPKTNVPDRSGDPEADPSWPYTNSLGSQLAAPGHLNNWRDIGQATVDDFSNIYDVTANNGYNKVVDHNGMGIYVNPEVSEFCAVDMSVVNQSIELSGDSISLGTSASDYYTELFTKDVKPTYVLSDLVSISSPKTLVPDFSLSGINGTTLRTTRNDTLLASLEAGFTRDDEPSIGWLQLDPANGEFIAEANITIPIAPSETRNVDDMQIAATSTNPIPGLFNFKEGKYVPLVSWVIGQRNSSTDATTNSQTLIRIEIYAKRVGSRIEIRYMMWATCQAGSNTSTLRPTVSGIQIPGLSFKFATLFS